MTEKYAVLPCNGLDKCGGAMSREIALLLQEGRGDEIICPVLYHASGSRYDKWVKEAGLVVVDGCPTRCASKLAAEKEWKIAKKIVVTDEVKKAGGSLPSSLRLGENELALCRNLASEVQKAEAEEVRSDTVYPAPEAYATYAKGKFVFRVPTEGFYFTENDCWVQKVGNRVRIGITDYMQQSLSDIMFVTPPAVGAELEQFDEAGNLESGKAVFELICPVTGVVVAVNGELLQAPELVNQSPYEKGWMAELELANFAEEEEFLLGPDDYMKILKKKVDEFHGNQR